jgi:uncharacterized OB-fold protein
MTRSAPVPDQASAFYWAGAARGQLLVQRCTSCRSFQYPPTVVCEHCQSRELTVEQVSGRGTLYARTVLHQAFLPEFAEEVPFTLALVDLDDAPGARLLTNLVQADPHTVAAGDPVEVVFESHEGFTLPQFRPVGVRS